MKKFLFILLIIGVLNTLLLSFSPKKQKKIISAGTIIPELVAVDSTVAAFMSKWKIPGGSVALVNNGKLVYARGFGYADQNTPTRPDHLFRIASLSKPVTAAAIMKLMETGKISLEQKIFGVEGILNDLKYSGAIDRRIHDITVTHLLEHTAGWDREVSSCGDPMFDPITIAQRMNAQAPATAETVIRYMLTQPLDFTPGTRYAYSNIGYSVLGRVIEKITGLSYEEYVKKNILTPAGIKDMQLGKNRLCDRNAMEVKYHDYADQNVPSVCEPEKSCPYPYGGFNLEAMDAHGGWMASATDLAKFLIAVDGKNKNDILQKNSIKLMTQASAVNQRYGKGWMVNSNGNQWHTGCLTGTSAMMANISNGNGWVLLFNANPGSSQYFQELDRLMWKALEKTTRWPAEDLFEKETS